MLILQRADATKREAFARTRPPQSFKIDEAHVRDELVDLAARGYITLTGWDGNLRKPWDQWPSAEAFFNSGFDSHTKWIKLRSKGKEIQETLKSETEPQQPEQPRSKIGFV